MLTNKIKHKIVLLFLFLVFFLSSLEYSQHSFAAPPITVLPTTNAQAIPLKDDLELVTRNLDWVKKNLQKKEQEMRESVDPGLKQELTQELFDLRKRMRMTEGRLMELAAGIPWEDAQQVSESVGNKRDVINELQDLVVPVLDALQRVSKRPRKIEGLRREIDTLENKILLLDQGKGNLQGLMLNYAQEKQLVTKLQELQQFLWDKQEELKLRLADLKGKLNLELSQEKSLVVVMGELTSQFFSRRGQHLMLSILGFALVFILLLRLRRWLHPEEWFNRKEELKWLKRPFALLYNLLVAVLSFCTLLFCLYVLNDWVLLTFFMLVLLSILWSLKQLMPKFIVEGKLLLNLGSVREDERVVWNGISWRVDTLGPHTTLVNPALEGGAVRVRAQDLLHLYSRRIVAGEEWFPCKRGDWVDLSDGSYGEVVLQTPEQVVLQLDGLCKKYYRVGDFLAQNPKNYSHGYVISVTLALSYSLQAEIVSGKIQQILEEEITASLKIFTQYKCNQGNNSETENLISKVQVIFINPGNNALELAIRVSVAENGAVFRGILSSEVNSIILTSCCKHGWNIPYPQVVVHSANLS
ncbi:MAG: hypothetical protein HQK53_10240 [Oligoflexia bacterium]|nr:hypothetical protein [Oligoflexia bacterium]